MSTHASVTFYENDVKYVTVHHHSDGYINGVGHELAVWLKQKTIGNGISMDSDENFCNGVGCLAAQYIRDNKSRPGYLYIDPVDSSKGMMDFNYHVYINTDSIYRHGYKTEDKNVSDITLISINNFDNPKQIFLGTVDELLHTTDGEVFGDE